MNTIGRMMNRLIKLSLPKPEAGIHECEWTIEAKDEAEAIVKFSGYLVQLKRQFTHQPLPIRKSTDASEVTREFVRRLTLITEPVAFIVTLHLFIEHCLNQMLVRFCPNRDLTKYTFYKKLEIVYSMNRIPENLFKNLCKLNGLRNKVAHDPDCDLTQMDLEYLDCPPDVDLSQLKPSYAANAEHNHIFNILTGIMFVTYVALQNHCMKEFGFGQQWKITEVPPVAADESDRCTV
jgi:hypothetical protein